MIRLFRACLLAPLVLLPACEFPGFGPEAASEEKTDPPGVQTPDKTSFLGRARITAPVPTYEDVARVVLEIVWEGGATPPVDMFQFGPTSFEIVVGNLPVYIPCTVRASAVDSSGALLYEGSVSNIVFLPNVVIDLILNLLPVDAALNLGRGPRIEAVRRPAAPIYRSSVVDVEFVLSDPDDTSLNYELSSSGDGTFDTPSGAVALTDGSATLAVLYTAPSEPGEAVVSIRVEDAAELAAEFSFSLTVIDLPVSQRDGAAAISVNFPPVINSVTARQTERSTEIELHADVQDDGPPGELAFSWSVDGALFSTDNPATYPSDVGLVAVSLTVTDPGGAYTTVVFDLDTAEVVVEDLPPENRPPVIGGAFLSKQEGVSYGETVTLLLYASDPDADDLGGTWSATRGTILSSSQDTQGEWIVFEALWEADVEAGVAEVTARITDPRGGAAVFVFWIEQVLGRVDITADAGEDQEAFVGGFAHLDATGSESEDGVITAYLWEQISGPDSVIETPDQATTVVVPTIAGTYRYRLTVWNVNNSDSDEVQISVSDPHAFMFEDADMTDGGMIYFLDRTDRRVRRYDATTDAFLPSFQTDDLLRRMAVAPEGDAVYVGYEGGRMDVIDTATAERSFFAAAPTTVSRMAVVANYLFTIDSSGSWSTHSLYDRSNGVRTFADDWRNNSNGAAYARTLRRIFTFRDGTSPNDIIRTDVNLEDGTLGPDIDSPYHGDYSFTHPMRLFPDELTIAVASGVIFSTSDLTYAGSLGMSYEDMAFHSGQPYLINAVGSQTELTIMNVDFSIQEVRYYEGEPLRLFIHGDTLLLITRRGDRQIAIETVDLSEE